MTRLTPQRWRYRLPCCDPVIKPGPSGVAWRHGLGCTRGRAGNRISEATARLLELQRARDGGTA